MTDWISVKTALPERVGVYLCQCDKWGDFTLQILYFYPETGRFKKRIGVADMTENVTHWMELPEEAANGQGQT